MATKVQEKQTNPEQHKSTGTLQTAEKDVKPIQEFVTKFNNDWSMNLSAALAYNLLMAIFPIIIALLAILGVILGTLSPSAFNNLTNSIAGIFPSATASQIKNLLTSAQDQLAKASGILAIIAVILALFNGSRLFLLIEGCFGIIYHVRQRAFIPQNIMAFSMLLLFIILVPIMVVAATGPTLAFSILQKTPLALIPGMGLLFNLGGILGGILAAFLFFWAIYIVVPNQPISWRNSWLGAVVAAVLLQLYLILFPLYVAHFLTTGAAATIGSAVILLIFFYYFAVILFLGAEVNAFFAEGVHATPDSIPAMIHEMTSHLQTSKEAIQEQAAATHKGEKPKDIHPKGERTGTAAAHATTPAVTTEHTEDHARTNKVDKKSKKQKSTGSRISLILEAVAGTALAFLVEFFRLRRRK